MSPRRADNHTVAPWFTRHRRDARDRVLAAILLFALAAGLLAIGLKDPRTHGLGVLCPSRRFLGIYCPGCGSTRATHDLLHGDLAGAFRNNPLLVLVGAPLLVVAIGSLVWIVARGERLAVRVPYWLGISLAVLLVCYGVARNIPGKAFEPLRPPTAAAAAGRSGT
jgi:hypothetical protein